MGLEIDLAEAAAPKKISAEKKTPRYLQLAGELREAIVSGRYANGRQFPTETALCKQFDVSRFTVREALKRLQGEGLIERKRGSGTIVQPASARGGALHQPLSNVGELLQYARGSEVIYSAQGSGTLPASVSDQIEESTNGIWRRFSGTRRQNADSPPIAVTDAYFHEKLGDAVEQLDLGAGTLFSQIEKLTGITVARVTQDIQAIAANSAMARALDIKRGEPILRIIRCYLDTKGAVYEISVSHHPGNRFAYSMHIDLDA